MHILKVVAILANASQCELCKNYGTVSNSIGIYNFLLSTDTRGSEIFYFGCYFFLPFPISF